MNPSLPSCHMFALSSHLLPCILPTTSLQLFSPYLLCPCLTSPELLDTVPASQQTPHALHRPASSSSTSPHSRFRVPSPSLSPCPHTRSPQLPQSGPAPRCPAPVSRYPVSMPRVRVPYPSRHLAPAGPAAPGRSRPLCPTHPLVTTNHSARLCQWGRREPIGRRVRGAGGGASVSRPEEA